MKKISDAVIRRLPKYYRYLVDLERQGVEKISSNELSEKMGLNASQIRQDFNCFGGFGQQGFGYYVKVLKNEIQAIIGLNKTYDMILVGVGNIGQALARYQSFSKEGFHLVGMFDVDPQLVGKKINDVEIQHMDALEKFVQARDVRLGIICTPDKYAMEVAQRLAGCGIKAIWNFAPIDVQCEDVIVENVHLSDSLYTLAYKLNEKLKSES